MEKKSTKVDFSSIMGEKSTNHVDRILGNFDPPPPYVDTFTK